MKWKYKIKSRQIIKNILSAVLFYAPSVSGHIVCSAFRSFNLLFYSFICHLRCYSVDNKRMTYFFYFLVIPRLSSVPLFIRNDKYEVCHIYRKKSVSSIGRQFMWCRNWKKNEWNDMLHMMKHYRSLFLLLTCTTFSNACFFSISRPSVIFKFLRHYSRGFTCSLVSRFFHKNVHFYVCHRSKFIPLTHAITSALKFIW